MKGSLAGILLLASPTAYAQDTPPLRTFRVTGAVHAAACSPDGRFAASGGIGTAVRILDLEDGSTVKVLKGHKSFINAAAYSPDGKFLATGSEDGVIRLWDAGSGECLETLRGHSQAVSALAFLPAGESFVSAGGDGMLRLWRAGAGKPYLAINTRSGYAFAVAVSSDGALLASGGADGTVKLWDAATGRLRMTFEGHEDSVNAVAFPAAGGLLASAGEDGTARVWTVGDAGSVKIFQSGRKPLLAVAFSPDGSYLLAGGADAQVSLWRVQDQGRAGSLKGHSGRVKALSVSPDGKHILTAGADRTIRLWLAPWEAERAQKTRAEYDRHFSAGNEMLSRADIESIRTAVGEFTRACSLLPGEACTARLKEAAQTLRRKEEQRRRNIDLGSKGLAAFVAFYLVYSLFARARKKAHMRAALPGEIKDEILSGNYDQAMTHLRDFKAAGGDPKRLPQMEILELFRCRHELEDLPKEDLPYTYLFSYALVLAKEGNYRMAFAMTRSGGLLDDLKMPAEFDAFAEIYAKAGRPASLFEHKLAPQTCSSLAEALFRAGDKETCGRVCAAKKRLYPGKTTQRDKELMTACGGEAG